jgi:FAD-dependent urate hydroxylase
LNRGCDIAIVGAGPYGLSAAAHLRATGDRDVRVFGEPMGFWQHCMPAGMRLRSPYVATNIADPQGALTLDAYKTETGRHLEGPVPLERFVEYGRWYQGKVVADADPRLVKLIEPAAGGFVLTLEDGEPVYTSRAIVAAGIGPFRLRPLEFAGLPRDLVSHASDHSDLSGFAGRSVVVVGAGQSALESAALLHEAGANTTVIARAATVNWLGRSAWIHTLAPFLYAPPDVGPAGVSWLVAWPNVFRRLHPRKLQDRLAKRAIRPAGSGWLAPRLKAVPIECGLAVRAARQAGDRVKLSLSDGSNRLADHVLLGTGYSIDISKYSFIDRSLLGAMRVVEGQPVLGRGFESSISGLHFLGAPAAWSFGPLMRFVAGTEFAGPALARALAAEAVRGRRVRRAVVSEPSVP